MSYKGVNSYILTEIKDSEWVTELLSETFGDAIEMMTSNSIVYGGAIRDCLAGKPLIGDLDFAVSRREFKELSLKFINNPRWEPTNLQVPTVPSHNDKSFPTLRVKLGGSGKIAMESAPMSGVSSFKTMNGRIVQLITSKKHTIDSLADAMYVASTVDITCCGVLMTSDGRVFEIVPNAYKDCKELLLNINRSSKTIAMECLQERVDKLISRGWTNKIDVKKELSRIEAERERERKRMERLGVSAPNSIPGLRDRAKSPTKHPVGEWEYTPAISTKKVSTLRNLRDGKEEKFDGVPTRYGVVHINAEVERYRHAEATYTAVFSIRAIDIKEDIKEGFKRVALLSDILKFSSDIRGNSTIADITLTISKSIRDRLKGASDDVYHSRCMSILKAITDRTAALPPMGDSRTSATRDNTVGWEPALAEAPVSKPKPTPWRNYGDLYGEPSETIIKYKYI